MTKKKQTNKKTTTNRREAATGMRATGILSFCFVFTLVFSCRQHTCLTKIGMWYVWRQEKNERQESDFPVAHFPVAHFSYKS